MTPAADEAVVNTTNNRLHLGDGLRPGGFPIPNAFDIQNQAFTYPSVGGTGDAILLTNTPPKSALVAGQSGTFKAGANNTTAVQINEDGLGLKDAKYMSGGSLVALPANALVAGGMYDYFWDGTQYQIKGLAAGGGGSLKFLGAATASSSAAISLTSLLSATYDDYLIVLDNVLPASNNNTLNVRFSPDNSTFDAGTNYFSNQILAVAGAVSSVAASAMNQISIGTNGGIVRNNAAEGISGQIYVHNVNSTAVYRYLTGTLAFVNSSDGGVAAVTLTGVWTNTSNALEALQFFFTSGNIASGTFKVYGIAKS